MTDARAAIHAMFNLGEVGEYVLDQRLDALVAEARRTDAAHLLDQRHHHLHRAIFCDGIKYSARLLETRAGETTEKATAPAATATEYGISLPADDDGPACVLDPTDDKTDAERRLDRYRDRHPGAVLVQRAVTYGGWTDITEAGTR